MRLLPRLFRSHALVVLLTVLAELFAPTFIQHHVDQMVELIGPAGRSLRGDLSRGMRNTFTGARLLSAAFALLVAFITAFLASQQVVGRSGSSAPAARPSRPGSTRGDCRTAAPMNWRNWPGTSTGWLRCSPRWK